MIWFRAARLALARWLPVLLLATTMACAAPGAAAHTSHSCADKVAQAAVSQTVPGLWGCLSPSFQDTLHSYGLDGDGAIVTKAFALSWKYIGSTASVADYELTLMPDVAAQAGVKSIPLTVFLDSSGHVTNLGVAQPSY
jgi:hypothetical protein